MRFMEKEAVIGVRNTVQFVDLRKAIAETVWRVFGGDHSMLPIVFPQNTHDNSENEGRSIDTVAQSPTNTAVQSLEF